MNMKETSLEEQLAGIASSFPSPQMALFPALRCAAQEGEITPSMIATVAQVCHIGEDSVRSLLIHYPDLKGPSRKVTVCGGLSCWLMGAGRVFATPERYGFGTGELERALCLGYCFAAPVARSADGTMFQIELQERGPLRSL